jgi:hypothetical protein
MGETGGFIIMAVIAYLFWYAIHRIGNTLEKISETLSETLIEIREQHKFLAEFVYDIRKYSPLGKPTSSFSKASTKRCQLTPPIKKGKEQ